MPLLNESGAKLFMVSIGTYERSKEFVERTGFPAELLFVDPGSTTYKSLGLVKGVRETFFSAETAFSFKKRIQESKLSDLGGVMPRWKAWIPPKQDQALQQGGMFVFRGAQCVFAHFDKGTGAHADFKDVLAAVEQALGN